jgi:hypothetical protein
MKSKYYKYTPGPWFIKPDNYSKHRAHIAFGRTDVLGQCGVIARELAYLGEQKANAHLMAAAPVMFEALLFVAGVDFSLMTEKQIVSTFLKMQDVAKQAIKAADQDGQDKYPRWSGSLHHHPLLRHDPTP